MIAWLRMVDRGLAGEVRCWFRWCFRVTYSDSYSMEYSSCEGRGWRKIFSSSSESNYGRSFGLWLPVKDGPCCDGLEFACKFCRLINRCCTCTTTNCSIQSKHVCCNKTGALNAGNCEKSTIELSTIIHRPLASNVDSGVYFKSIWTHDGELIYSRVREHNALGFGPIPDKRDIDNDSRLYQTWLT